MHQKPDFDQLEEFFKSDIFQQALVQKGDFAPAIAEFYRRFYPDMEQARYQEIGIRINRIIRKPIILEEETQVQGGENIEYRSDVYFEYLLKPGHELSLALIGLGEEQAFYNATKEELLDFFVFKFRRFSKLLVYGGNTQD